MVVLNLLGKIEPICISQKLKLYVSNLPQTEDNNWMSHLVEEMEIALKLSAVKSEMYEAHYGKTISKDIKSIFKTKYPHFCVEKMSEQECIQRIADEMICLYFDYDYTDMPVGDWTSNCFDGRLCEGDYAERISYFIHLLCKKDIHDKFPQIPPSAPFSIYFSDSYDDSSNYRFIFNGTTDIKNLLENLVQFGKLLDGFLISENDYYFLDYICSELYQIDRETFSANHCQKLYSLCEFFLEKDTDQELDEKLPPFLRDTYSFEDRKQIAVISRQIRNKVAHGDFLRFKEKIEEYASTIMEKNGYWFDYSEYSRQNWAIMNLCFNLLHAIENLLAESFCNRSRIEALKKQKISNDNKRKENGT